MPKDRQADCSALGRAPSAGPPSQAAANSSAVLPRITQRYSSSVVAVFLAAASCITSPSAMMAAAEDRISSEGGEPAAAHLALVHDVVVQQRSGVHELDRGSQLDVAVAPVTRHLGHRQRE